MSNGWQSFQRSGGTGDPAGPVDGTPDWAALAEQHQQDQRRRRQRRIVLTAAAATLAVTGITVVAVAAAGSGGRDGGAAKLSADGPATASASESGPDTAPPTDLASSSGSSSPSPSPSASPSARPSARTSAATSAAPATSAPAPMDPLTVISSAATDTEPISPDTVFAAKTMTVGGKIWTRTATATSTTCWQATTGHLGDVLTAQGCRQLLRATYTSGNSTVTVGVAMMDTKAQADAVEAGNKGQIQGLAPAGATAFCTSAGCANTHAAIGRYTYYTVQGTVKPGGNTADPTANAAAPDFAGYARAQLLARGVRH